MSDYEEFRRKWAVKIEARARKTVGSQGASVDYQDLRQVAEIAAWKGFLAWRALPDAERDPRTLDAMVTSRVRDATLDEWCRVSGRARKSQRGSGVRAQLFRDYLTDLSRVRRSDFVHGRPDMLERMLLQYQLGLYGTLHGQTGLVGAETKLVRGEVSDRIVFALAKLDEKERAMIEGVFLHERTHADVGSELGIHEPWAQSRLCKRALKKMRKWMDEYASALGPHNTGGTLDDEPIGGA
jgi:RNA polymerase sigma factor (sigma-70 family)